MDRMKSPEGSIQREHEATHDPTTAAHTAPLGVRAPPPIRLPAEAEIDIFEHASSSPPQSHFFAPSSMEDKRKGIELTPPTPTSSDEHLEKKNKTKAAPTNQQAAWSPLNSHIPSAAQTADVAPSAHPLTSLVPLQATQAATPQMNTPTLHAAPPMTQPDNTAFQTDATQTAVLSPEEFYKQIQQGVFSGTTQPIPSSHAPTGLHAPATSTHSQVAESPKPQARSIQLDNAASSSLAANPSPHLLGEEWRQEYFLKNTINLDGAVGSQTYPPSPQSPRLFSDLEPEESRNWKPKQQEAQQEFQQRLPDHLRVPLNPQASPLNDPALSPTKKSGKVGASASSSSSSSAIVSLASVNHSHDWVETKDLFDDIVKGLAVYPPEEIAEGASQAHYLFDEKHNFRAVFKMKNHETDEPRDGRRAGQTIANEVMAYAIHKEALRSRYGVPLTFLADLPINGKVELGSIQQYVPKAKSFIESSEELISNVSTDELAKLALNFIIGNKDGNPSNVLIDRETGEIALIDNGDSFLGIAEIGWHDALKQEQEEEQEGNLWIDLAGNEKLPDLDRAYLSEPNFSTRVMAAFDKQAQKISAVDEDIQYDPDQYIAQHFRAELASFVAEEDLTPKEWLILLDSKDVATMMESATKDVNWDQDWKAIDSKINWASVHAELANIVQRLTQSAGLANLADRTTENPVHSGDGSPEDDALTSSSSSSSSSKSSDTKK